MEITNEVLKSSEGSIDVLSYQLQDLSKGEYNMDINKLIVEELKTRAAKKSIDQLSYKITST